MPINVMLKQAFIWGVGASLGATVMTGTLNRATTLAAGLRSKKLKQEPLKSV